LSVTRRNYDGSRGPATPLTPTGDFDAEVYGTGPWTWITYRGDLESAAGHARTRFGLHLALWRARFKAKRPA
jgi:hypothetical protein